MPSEARMQPSLMHIANCCKSPQRLIVSSIVRHGTKARPATSPHVICYGRGGRRRSTQQQHSAHVIPEWQLLGMLLMGDDLYFYWAGAVRATCWLSVGGLSGVVTHITPPSIRWGEIAACIRMPALRLAVHLPCGKASKASNCQGSTR